MPAAAARRRNRVGRERRRNGDAVAQADGKVDRDGWKRDAPDQLVTEDEAFGEVAQNLLDVIERDEAGNWHMPWTGVAAFPTNCFSGRRFRSSNVPILWAAAAKGKFTCHLWAPAPQWKSKGGAVKLEAKGAVILVPQFAEDGPVARWGRNTPDIAKKLGPIGADAEGGESRPFLGFKRERWFNAEEVDGIDIRPPEPPAPLEAARVMEAALRFWNPTHNNGPALANGGMRACWVPDRDRITMPPRAAFLSRGEVAGVAYYVQCLGHEMIHATGSKGRLKRDNKGAFGSSKYAREELVAEIGTAFLCAHFGLPKQLLEHSATYVKSWREVLGGKSPDGARVGANQRKAFFWAVKQAEIAARFLLAKCGRSLD